MVEIETQGNRSTLVKVAIPRPLFGLFTYEVPFQFQDQIKPGHWVQVPFGKGKSHAYVVEATYTVSPEERTKLEEAYKLKSIVSVSKSPVLTQEIIQLCKWTAEYYHIPMGEVLLSAVPKLTLTEPKRKPKAKTPKEFSNQYDHLKYTDEQEAAIAFIHQSRSEKSFCPILLEGVTGSGKTEVYAEIAKSVIAEGKSVLFLVPEIALTPQTQRRIESRLKIPVSLWHSALADGERTRIFNEALNGEVKVVVGARSAVFLPLKSLGLIIIDEEHDPSYKQEDRSRYHARDVAIMRAKINQCPLILGSATPSFECLENANTGKFLKVQLANRANDSRLPQIVIEDLAQAEWVPETQIRLSTLVLKEIQETVTRGEQVMIYLNRRGWASFLLCEDCGHVPQCEHCSISYTFHKKPAHLKCHLCGKKAELEDQCPKCKGLNWAPVGSGTESAAEDFEKLLAGAKICRLDRDQITSQKRLEQVLGDFKKQTTNVMIGTQMIVKGHDFPNVTLVVVMLADSLFKWPDFRSSERAYQILSQVAGRSGRGDKPGKVIIQTFNPTHEVIRTLLGEMTIEEFRKNEREIRSLLHYPPFGRMGRIRVSGKDQGVTQAQADAIVHFLTVADVEILGPSEAVIERLRGEYRWDIVLRSQKVDSLHRAISKAEQFAQSQEISIAVDVDPVSMS